MALELVLGISGVRDPVGKRDVHKVELVPHLVGGGVEQTLYIFPELGGRHSFTLRPQDVVVAVLGPCFRNRDTGG